MKEISREEEKNVVRPWTFISTASLDISFAYACFYMRVQIHCNTIIVWTIMQKNEEKASEMQQKKYVCSNRPKEVSGGGRVVALQDVS
jgi:hypothetical protein